MSWCRQRAICVGNSDQTAILVSSCCCPRVQMIRGLHGTGLWPVVPVSFSPFPVGDLCSEPESNQRHADFQSLLLYLLSYLSENETKASFLGRGVKGIFSRVSTFYAALGQSLR